jgi:pentatricopeptide repeat protein
MASYHLADGAADVASNEAHNAHSMFELANDSAGMVNATRVQLGAAMELGRYPEVISIALKALKGLELSKRHLEAADVILDAALAFHELGADDIALEYAIEAQKKFGGTSFPLFKRMSVEMAFGVINEGLGNLNVALEHHSLALDMVQRLGDPDRLRMVCYGNLGNTLLALGEVRRARDKFRNQLSLARHRHNIREQSSALCGLGKVSRVCGEPEASRLLLSSGFTLATKARHRAGRLRAMEALAELEEWQGNYDVASNWYGRLMEEIAAGKTVSFYRLHSDASNRLIRSLINRYIHCLCKAGDVSSAFEMFEKSRLERSIDNPYLVDLGLGFEDSALIDRKIGEFKALMRKACELALSRKKSPSWLMNSEIDLNTVLTITELELRRTEITEAIARMDGPSESFDLSAQTSRGLIQTTLLAEEDAVLEYVVGDTYIDMFCLTRYNLTHAVFPVKSSNLENIAARLSPVGRRSITERYLDLTGFSSFDDTLAHKMFLGLIKPFGSELLGKRKLTIVRDGPLSDIPFEFLCVGLGLPDTSRYLVGRYEVSYASSATSLCRIKENGRLPKVAFLGLGNPEPVPVADMVGSIRPRISAKAHSVDVRSLPEAEVEVKELSTLFGEEAICLVQEEATESAFKEKARDCAIIHIGAHAQLDIDSPMLSCLKLRGDSLKGEDGELMAYEIAELKLSAKLVVLSSCASLGGNNGLATDGLLRGFVDAGVPSIVGTTWEIEDRDARAFMGFLYRELRAGKNIAAALQQAKLSFIKTGRADPYRWAPYILVGKPGVTIGEQRSQLGGPSRDLLGDLAWYALYAVLLAGMLRMMILKVKAGGRRRK